jgi:hypothetical protein
MTASVRRLFRLFVHASLCLAAILPAAAEPLRAIDMDAGNASILPMTGHSNVGPHIRDGVDTISTTYDTGTKYSIWRADHGYQSPHSLGLRIDREDRPKSPKSKIEINVARHDDSRQDDHRSHNFILRNGTERYLGFAIELDPKEYEAPLRWLLHFQAWQCCATQPPLTLQALPTHSKDRLAPVSFVLIRRDDSNLSQPPTSKNGHRISLMDGSDRFVLQRGQWYRFVMRLRPGQDSEAGVDVWMNGRLLASYHGPWGYRANPFQGITDRYAIKLGIYRHANDTKQQVYIDSIRWGLTRDDVDPEQK